MGIHKKNKKQKQLQCILKRNYNNYKKTSLKKVLGLIRRKRISINAAAEKDEGRDNFFEWCRRNGFELNVDKCKTMTLTRKRSPILTDYQINGKPLKRVYNIKDLGVNYKDDFSFNVHYELA